MPDPGLVLTGTKCGEGLVRPRGGGLYLITSFSFIHSFFGGFFSASDVPESPVPERQRVWRARVLVQVQRSRGESERTRVAALALRRGGRELLLAHAKKKKEENLASSAFVATATASSSGLWWLQNGYGKRCDICDRPEIKGSVLGGEENS